jgi:hypothetical protein
MEKICNKCHKSLPIEQFSRRKLKDSIGYEGRCRDCISKHKAVWRQAHPGYHKDYYEQHKVLKPLITKICPNCHKTFKTNQPHQIRCNDKCLPMTAIRKLKAYLFNHPEIDKESFFKGRYFNRYKYYATT